MLSEQFLDVDIMYGRWEPRGNIVEVSLGVVWKA
jgi:hypothetical protein